MTILDATTSKYTLIDTCFQTHHLMFADDANETLWLRAAVPVRGGRLGQPQRSSMKPATLRKPQGWTPFILDTNGDGKRDDYIEPNAAVDPTKDRRIANGFYGVVVPQDGTVWGKPLSPWRGCAVRLQSEDAAGRNLLPPMPGYGGRGGDIDSNGVLWVSLASGHIGEFDRRKCKVLNGPTRDRQALPGRLDPAPRARPALRRREGRHSAEASYYTWVD